MQGSGGGGVLPIMVSAQKGYLFQASVGILLIEVYERVGKSIIWVCERAQRANRWIYFQAL